MTLESTLFIVDEDPSTHTVVLPLARAEGIQTKIFTGVDAFFRSDFANRGGCILIAADITGLNGLDALAWLSTEGVSTPVIVLISHGDAASGIRALKLGACDVLEKPIDETTLRASVTQALAIGACRHQARESRANAALRIERLTNRERQVFELLCMGKTNKEIANKIGCKPRTVEVHRARIMEKLNAENVVELLRLRQTAEGTSKSLSSEPRT